MSRQGRDREQQVAWLRRVDDFFVRALDMEPAQREEFLAQEGKSDPELRLEVEELLAAAEEEDSLLRSGGAAAGGLLGELFPELAPHQPNDRVGRYRIVSEIGRGGMGVVYLAERADGAYEQQVAVKLMRLGAGPEALARFTRERQILARLEHPHIARLLDGGVSEAGHPYLVVEYVDGEEIVGFCARRELSTEERLRLFCNVCEAIETAHRQLVVHLDIKPSNILVTPESEVKLLDFGIAKLMQVEGEEGLLTQPGSRAITPHYASPEQIDGRPVTVASDVYQLGLLGYELLTGQRPYKLAGMQLGEAWRRTIAQPPPWPRKVAAASDDRQVRDRAKSMTRDLDAILLKALRTSAERRYGSVDRLREDVERWLSGRPVLAQPDRLGYRLSKFVGRHKAIMAVAALALIGLVTLTFGFTWRLARERDQTLLAADRELQALAGVEQLHLEGEEVLEFLEGLFEVSDPMDSAGEVLTARGLLDRGAERIAEELAEQPAVRARMMHTLGGLYSKLGLFDRAEELLVGARELRAVDPASRAYAESTSTLGFFYYDSGKWDRAAELLQQALALLEVAPPADELAIAATLYRLAIVLGDSGAWQEAEALYQRALEIYVEEQGARSYEASKLYNSMAINASWQGQSQQAETLYLRSLEIQEELFGSDDPRLGKVLNNLGLLNADLGRPQRSVEFLEQALKVKLPALGEDHPDIAVVRMNLGIGYLYITDLKNSEEQLDEAELILRRALDPRHPTLIDLENALGRLRRLQGKLTESLAHLDIGNQMAVEILGDEHERVARSLVLRGKTLVVIGRFREAKEQLQEAFERYQRLEHTYDHYDAAVALAGACAGLGEVVEAERLLRETLRNLEEANKPQGQLQLAATTLARLLRDQQRPDEARQIEVQHGLERGGKVISREST